MDELCASNVLADLVVSPLTLLVLSAYFVMAYLHFISWWIAILMWLLCMDSIWMEMLLHGLKKKEVCSILMC
jgi:hypothetical protein